MLRTRPIPPAILLPIIAAGGDPPTFHIGADIARFGSDHSVAWLQHANGVGDADWAIGLARWSGIDTFQSAMIISDLVQEWEETGWICMWVGVDSIGIGAGVVDALWNKSQRYGDLVKPIQFAMQSKSQSPRFRNVRSELAWNVRTKFRSRRCRILMPASLRAAGIEPQSYGFNSNYTECVERLREQMLTVTYRADEKFSGVINVESKDDYKKRLGGKSPDEFDAYTIVNNDALAGVERSPKGRSLPITFQR